MARLGPRFGPPKSPRKSLCGSLFCVLSQEMRHINFFLGAQNGVFWAGAKKFMLKHFMRFFGPLELLAAICPKVPEGHHPRGTTVHGALRGNLPLTRVLRGLCGFCGALRGSAGVHGIFRGQWPYFCDPAELLEFASIGAPKKP